MIYDDLWSSKPQHDRKVGYLLTESLGQVGLNPFLWIHSNPQEDAKKVGNLQMMWETSSIQT